MCACDVLWMWNEPAGCRCNFPEQRPHDPGHAHSGRVRGAVRCVSGDILYHVTCMFMFRPSLSLASRLGLSIICVCCICNAVRSWQHLFDVSSGYRTAVAPSRRTPSTPRVARDQEDQDRTRPFVRESPHLVEAGLNADTDTLHDDVFGRTCLARSIMPQGASLALRSYRPRANRRCLRDVFP